MKRMEDECKILSRCHGIVLLSAKRHFMYFSVFKKQTLLPFVGTIIAAKVYI